MLQVEGLRKAYGDVQALDGADLTIDAGEICGLLGPNGAGKTTLVSITAGLRRPDAGQVTVNGIDAVARPGEARHHLGLAPQDLGVYPPLTVRDNIRYFAELAGVRGRDVVVRTGEVAEALDLGDLLDRPVRFLSGGEKRRVHTALAMVHRPALLLLDEPTTGVDVSTRARLLDVVRGLADGGVAVCYSTHYLAEVESLGASVAILDRGRVIARGPVRDLVARHGRTAVELIFDGEPPPVSVDRPCETAGNVIRIFTERPAADAAAVLATLGEHAGRLLGIEVVRSSLESVFLALTGRRYSGADGSEADAVGAGDDVQEEADDAP